MIISISSLIKKVILVGGFNMLTVIKFLLNPDTPFTTREKFFIISKAYLPKWLNNILWIYKKDNFK
jgi:hypothetical protein